MEVEGSPPVWGACLPGSSLLFHLLFHLRLNSFAGGERALPDVSKLVQQLEREPRRRRRGKETAGCGAPRTVGFFFLKPRDCWDFLLLRSEYRRRVLWRVSEFLRCYFGVSRGVCSAAGNSVLFVAANWRLCDKPSAIICPCPELTVCFAVVSS